MTNQVGNQESPSAASYLAPDPPAFSMALQGMEEGRALARRYLVNVVRLQAAIAFGKNTEAGLHTRMLAAKSIADIAGAVPQSTPIAPLLDSPPALPPHGNGNSGQP
jgi:hypothetical protein